jgi:hypothetical protein
MNDCKESDPMIKRVPMTTTEIGSRPVSLPKGSDAKASELGISHVGGSSGGSK